MSKKYDCPAVFPISTILAVFAFSTCWMVSDIADPTWIFGNSMLSDMGISNVDVTRILFNISCIVCGLILIAFGLCKVMCRVGIEAGSGFLIVPAGFFLAMVGIFPSDYVHWLHLFVAYGFGVCAVFSVLMSMCSYWYDRKMMGFGFGVTCIVVCSATMVSCNAALAEAWLVILFLCWILIDSIIMVIDDHHMKRGKAV